MATHTNPDLLRAFKELLVEPEMDEFRLVMQRAVDQSEVRADNPALEYVVHMMLGGFAIRTLIDELPPTQEFLVSYIDAGLLPALGIPTV